MRSRRMTAIAVVIAAAGALGFVGTQPAIAAPPPAGYPTQEVMTIADNPALGEIPIRRGFWDGGANRGWGMDKAWHYHNIPSLKAQRNVLLSPDQTLQGNGNWRLRAWAQKIECRNGTNCTVVDEREVWGIYNPGSFARYHGWPVGGVLGLQTMYCQQGGAIRCPSWVTLGLDRISNAPLSRSADGDVQTDALLEQGLTESERRAQEEFYASPEVQRLLEQAASGEVVFTFSYEPEGVGTPSHTE